MPIFTAMLYRILRLMVKAALPLYTRKIEILNAESLSAKGPLLLASNHPNSFLDAVMVGTHMKQPVHFITRGDVFKNKWARNVMLSINMIPIFRLRDGKDKLSLNEETFIKSVDVLRKGGLLLIFVEGFCENQTSLQLPLKKGAPRILQTCWQEGIPVRVLPVWLEYSSFNRFGKTIRMSLGRIFGQNEAWDIYHASGINAINAECTQQLLQLSAEPPFVHAAPPAWQRALLFLPAMLGAVVHAPLYLPINALVKKLNGKNVHHDAITLLSLLFLYPLYMLVIGAVLYGFTQQWWCWLAPFVVMPILAWCYAHWKTD